MILRVVEVALARMGDGPALGRTRGMLPKRPKHRWVSRWQPTGTPVLGSDGAVYAQHVYVCERCGTQNRNAPCKEFE